jgi:GNAT superfamily N-acetyltransferase
MTDLSQLTSTWVQGWAASRDLPAPEDIGDGISVACRQPGREVEIFAKYADADPESVTRLAARVIGALETTWLTAATTRPDRIAELLERDGLVLLKRMEKLMTADLREQPAHALPPGYRLHVEAADARIYIEVRDATGEIAARGAVGLTRTHAVIDRILTWPDHRRRGLGNAVMSALAAGAVQRGAHEGSLIASEEGQRLYARLGWADVADVLISAAPGTAYPS